MCSCLSLAHKKHPAKEVESAFNFCCKCVWKLWIELEKEICSLLRFLHSMESNMSPWMCLKMQFIHFKVNVMRTQTTDPRKSQPIFAHQLQKQKYPVGHQHFLYILEKLKRKDNSQIISLQVFFTNLSCRVSKSFLDKYIAETDANMSCV